MADVSKIEWTDATWNIVTGCSVVSPGCTNCYAMRLAGTRLKNHPSRAGLTRDTKAGPVWTGEVRFNEEWLLQPLQWKRPRMIFVCAHGDLFHPGVTDEQLDRIFAVMALARQHVFQVLTKRMERAREWLQRLEVAVIAWFEWCDPDPLNDHFPHIATMIAHPAGPRAWPLPNIWVGTSVEDRPRMLERAPLLKETPAAVRWWSAEPLLGDLGDIPAELLPDWVVLGGESGPGARPMHPDWARSVRDQCVAAGVPFFFKQWGTWTVIYDRDRDDPDWRRCAEIALASPKGRWINLAGGHGFHGDRLIYVVPSSKKAAGRLLDGVEHNGMPA